MLQIRDYIDEHLYDSHTIDGLCRQFNLNREKLQSGFKAQLGTTVHAYMVKMRMQRAAKRLVDTDDSIKAIALDSGYKKQRSFNKTFKTIFQLTPAAYRKIHGE
ncbi:helix-turn-helix transcriptional regulator [Puia sp. P3]|uniref:helix-turn-helix transcriptional regulator n=1 Tax=Puia sp. P3 TaxID=3423952 RepID=UPI003D673FCD